MRRVVIDAKRPSADLLAEAAAIIRIGGIVAMPTDTLYGLAVDPFSSSALSRLFDVKGRDAGRAIACVARCAPRSQAFEPVRSGARARLRADTTRTSINHPSINHTA